MKTLPLPPSRGNEKYLKSGFRISPHLIGLRTLAIALAIGTIVSACLGQQAARGRGAQQGGQQGGQQVGQQGRLPVDIRIELAQERFVTKESMVARILIRNTGSTPIEVPNPENNGNTQPVYTIFGPSYPKGYSFHFRGVA